MTILVTGGAGFIGSNFILDWFKEESEKVVNLDKLTYAGNPNNLAALENNEQYVFVKGDIGDQQLVSELLSKFKPRAIINFAAESHVDRSIHGPEAFIETNITGTFRLLEAVRVYWGGLSSSNTVESERLTDKENFRFLHISTDEVYGTLAPEAPPFTEQNQYQPNSPYSASKAASDHLVRAYFHTYGLPVLTTNCSNNYGPYQFPEKLIPLVIHNALAGKPLPIYGDGKQIRDWLYVGDHCAAIRCVLEGGHPGEVYNIGGLNEKTNLEIVNLVCDLLEELVPDNKQSIASGNHAGFKGLITYVKDRPGHDRRYAINASKMTNALGWRPAETFETGIRKTVTWYLDNRHWVKSITSGDYRHWIQKQYG